MLRYGLVCVWDMGTNEQMGVSERKCDCYEPAITYQDNPLAKNPPTTGIRLSPAKLDKWIRVYFFHCKFMQLVNCQCPNYIVPNGNYRQYKWQYKSRWRIFSTFSTAEILQ